MFARNVSIHLKPNTLSDYTRTLENEILPLLRKQQRSRRREALSARCTEGYVDLNSPSALEYDRPPLRANPCFHL